jgi:hypothetical protein
LTCGVLYAVQSNQITTLTFFRFDTLSQRYWAFTQMGLGWRKFQNIPGLSFYKLLGSGADSGFGMMPNWSVYGLLAVWKEESAARQFFESHPFFGQYRHRADAVQTVWLRAAMFHGEWDGACPFEAAATFDPAQPVAVLTRATIRRRHLWGFWTRVAPVSRDVEARPGLAFAVGVGELPLVQQATFSLWQSGKQMLDYAYRRPKHAEVIRRTRELGWYKEELFARFVPFRMEGSGIFDGF